MSGFTQSLGFRSALLSVLLLALLLGIWHLARSRQRRRHRWPPRHDARADRIRQADGKRTPAPALRRRGEERLSDVVQMGTVIAKHLASPFYDNGPTTKGIAAAARLFSGPCRARLPAGRGGRHPARFVIGMSPLAYRALDPFIQVLKPISPLAWMPLALYTIKDSAASGIFVIFICSIWPMLINTAFRASPACAANG